MSAPPSAADAPRRLVRPWPGWPAAAALMLWALTLAGGALVLAADLPRDAVGAAPPAALASLACPGVGAVAGGDGPSAPHPRLYLGLIPLVLALTALTTLSRVPRAVAATDVTLALGGLLVLLVPAGVPDPWRLPGAAVALAGGAHLAATGLAALIDAPALRPVPVAPAMAAALLALALATVLGIASLWAGAASDEAALRPWLWLSSADVTAGVSAFPEQLALAAARWRAVLDRAAVTAFVSLVALLWFLKRRDALAVGAVLLVVAADLAWAGGAAAGLA